MRMSAAGRARLAGFEGCVLTPYNDSAGHATIGIGHLIHHGPVTATDRAQWADFTKAKADQLFTDDLVTYEAPVNALGVPLIQNQFDACVSLCFNIGTGGFAGSEVARQIKARNWTAAANAFLNWSRPPELRPRREAERRWFLTPGSPAAADEEDDMPFTRDELKQIIREVLNEDQARDDRNEDDQVVDLKKHAEEVRGQLYGRLDQLNALLQRIATKVGA